MTPVRPTPAPQWTRTGVLRFLPIGTSATAWRRTVSISSRKPRVPNIKNEFSQFKQLLAPHRLARIYSTDLNECKGLAWISIWNKRKVLLKKRPTSLGQPWSAQSEYWRCQMCLCWPVGIWTSSSFVMDWPWLGLLNWRVTLYCEISPIKSSNISKNR